MDLPDLENPIKGLTRPAVIGVAIAGVIYTALIYYGVDLPITEKQVAYIGAAAGAIVASILGFLHGKFIKPIQIKALYVTQHLRVDEYLDNGWITPRQARLLHAKLAKDEILGIPYGTSFDITCYFSQLDLLDGLDDDPPNGGSTVASEDPDDVTPPASGQSIEKNQEEEKLELKPADKAKAAKVKTKVKETSLA